jgi:hypothetical protein
MSVLSHLGSALRWVVVLTVLAACSDGAHTNTPACKNNECGLDAAVHPSSVKPDAGRRRDGSVTAATFVAEAAAGQQLQARIQVNGASVRCGECAVLVAQVQGGVLPYTYEWSDPALSGAGPHMVCPKQPTTYSVIVTDESAVPSGEFAQAAQSVEAVGKVSCVEDAGIDGLTGCYAGGAGDGGIAESDASVTCGEPGDAGVAFDFTTGAQGTVTVSTALPMPFKAGRQYEYNHDRVLPFTVSIGTGVSVDIYGAREHCKPAEKLFSLVYDIFTWHQGYCFTPKEDYAYLIVAVHLDGVLFSWEFLTLGTACAGCSSETSAASP